VPDGAGQRARVGGVERLGVFGDLGLDRLGHFGDGCVGLQAEGPGHLGRKDTPHVGGFGQLQHVPHHPVTTVYASSCASGTAAYFSSTVVYL
jgi:hypothetical protein